MKMRVISQRLFFFVCRQFQEIGKGGWSILLPKARDLFSAILALPAVIIMRALSPLILIRVGPLYSKRIGHFAASPEIYLCERDKNTHVRKPHDILYYLKPISNYQLKKMWERILYVSPFSRFMYFIDRLNRLLPGGDVHVVPISIKKDRDTEGLLLCTTPHLSFSPEEERRGQREIRNLGIPEEAVFVCFHARDSAYLNTVYSDTDWRYQDFRNCSIQNYIPAVEELTKRGYFAVRMGALVRDPLSTDNPMIVDYASKHRTDFLDIYLSAKCKFFISSNSGISVISTIFRRPVVYANFIPLENAFACSAVNLFIPKKYWSREEKRFLTFHEMLNLGIGKLSGKYRAEKYEESGIDYIENTPQEITSVVIEMEERVRGSWSDTEEDEELQCRFWSLFTPETLSAKVHGAKNMSRIGTDFLRQNRSLLD